MLFPAFWDSFEQCLVKIVTYNLLEDPCLGFTKLTDTIATLQ